jgi:predicted secreted protein
MTNHPNRNAKTTHANLVIPRPEKGQTWLKIFIDDNPYPVCQVLLAGPDDDELSVTIRDWANVTKGIDYPIPA